VLLLSLVALLALAAGWLLALVAPATMLAHFVAH
jgi:hypothetical protein